MKSRFLHLTALAGFAVAQPLYDILSKSAEFFVAHRADRLDIVLLVIWLSAAVPLAAFAVLWAVNRLHRRAGAILMALFVGIFVAITVMPLVADVNGVGAAEVAVVSAMHGAIAALLYVAFGGVRQFMSLLAGAALVFPLWFLVSPGIRPLLRSTHAVDAGVDFAGDTPVVFVIFDQLPLTSLLDANGAIDSAAFPGFAALASGGIWYRNASTVADYTGWAIPALLTGNYPRARGLPIASSYPRNLFTVFGKRYRIRALEPLTDLCPDALCPNEDESRRERQRSMLADLTIVFARIVLPDEWTDGLPRLSENWRDFADADDLQDRWVEAREQDRTAPVRRFIASISGSDVQPTLYFAHVLLPHEPYVYLADQRRFSTESGLIGLGPRGRWSADPWYATQTYRQHLEQVGCADALVAALVDRLKTEGLYDRSLIVITSDHGVAFRPGRPMKGFMTETVPDVVPVPLFIKPPHHRGAEVSDRNVQSVDVLPTITSMLNASLPFRTQGAPARPDVPPAPEKRIFYAGATKSEQLPASLWDAVLGGARRKAALFGASSHAEFWLPADTPFKDLLGRRVADLEVAGKSSLDIELPKAWEFTDVRLSGPLVPSRVRGLIHGPEANSPVYLAVAVNGVVSAVTKSLAGPGTNAGMWAALVPPSRFKDGVNPIEVFEVTNANGATVLRTALRSSRLPPTLNLLDGEAKYDWNVQDTGLYPREPLGNDTFRWTNGDATLTVPSSLVPEKAHIAIHLTRMTRPDTPLTVTFDDCTLFDGPLPGGEWNRIFAIDRCPRSTRRGSEVSIRVRSGVAPAPPADGRMLGVPIAEIRFSSDEKQSSGG
jgi:hypothetical protein